MAFAFSLIHTVCAMGNKLAQVDFLKQDTVMKKLFLCSSFSDVASLLPDFMVSLKGKTVAFIPTASIHEEYRQYVEDGREALKALGMVVEDLEITRCGMEKVAQVLQDCDCIYISGGNTFFLMQELRRTGTDKLIVEQVEKGKPCIGESAGAMIFSPNIEYAKDMDDHLSNTSNFVDFTGLGIVDFYPVVHFNSFPFEEETQLIMKKNSDLSLLPISNMQAIMVFGDSISVRTKE